jgi:hypothetical protein
VQNNPINFVDPDGLRGDLPIFLPIPAREDYGTIFPQWMPAWIIDILYDIDNDPTAGLGGPGKAGLNIICKKGITLTSKIAKQMAKRGWTVDLIHEAMESGKRIPAINKATGDRAIRYVHPQTGQSVVVENATGKVIHVGGPGFKYGITSGDLP